MHIQRILDFLAEEPLRFFALATVVAVDGSAYRRPGARLLIANQGPNAGSISGGCLEADVIEHARSLVPGSSKILTYDTRADEDLVWGTGSGCNGLITILVERWKDGESPEHLLRLREKLSTGPVAIAIRLENASYSILPELPRDRASDESQTFFELVRPSPSLLLFGAGDDARAVARFADELGWRLTIIDTRQPSGFPARTLSVVAPLEQWPERLTVNGNDHIVIMTHHFEKDLTALRLSLDSPAAYVGLLGARKRTQRLIASLNPRLDPSRLHSPIGLDLGAETPAEIALAIVAEISAVRSDREGGFLRDGVLNPPESAENVRRFLH